MTTRTQEPEVKIPQAPIAELAIVGGLLLEQSVPPSVRTRLSPAQFFVQSSRKIYEAQLALDERGVPLDPVVVAEELRKAGELDAVGGWAYISTLTDTAIRGELDNKVDLVVEAAEKRHFHALGAELLRKASNGHTPAELREITRQAVEEFSQAEPDADDQADGGDFGSGFYKDLGELHAKVTVPAEDVMIGVRRRQTTLFNSVTNVGKTTVILNHCLAAAGGQKWDPLLPEAPDRPLKIIFVDAESTDDELRADTENMLAIIGNKDIARANFIPVLAQEVQIDGQMLDLSNRKHLLHLKNFVKYHQPDILVLETMSALFGLNNENDNAEVSRKVVRALKELTNAGNCAALMSHHIGQAGESDQREGAYSGRGASAFGGSLRAVISLKREKQRGPGFVRLTIEKMKGATPDPVTLELKGRTFLLCGQQQPEPVQTPYQKVVSVFNGHALGITDLEALLPGMSKSTIKRSLASALETGDLSKAKHGKYQKPSKAQKAQPYRDEPFEPFSEPAENVEDSLDFGDEDENGNDGTVGGYGLPRNYPDAYDDGEVGV